MRLDCIQRIDWYYCPQNSCEDWQTCMEQFLKIQGYFTIWDLIRKIESNILSRQKRNGISLRPPKSTKAADALCSLCVSCRSDKTIPTYTARNLCTCQMMLSYDLEILSRSLKLTWLCEVLQLWKMWHCPHLQRPWKFLLQAFYFSLDSLALVTEGLIITWLHICSSVSQNPQTDGTVKADLH